MTTHAEPLAEPSDNHDAIHRSTIVKCFVVVLALSFILRIAYAAHLYEDDGLWFTAGEEILRGKALYREIYFDKPPGLALVYAALFWIFGSHILTIRLFTILYSVAVSGVLYKFGSRLYDRRTGLLAAVMFTVFSTTYSTGHFQGLNTDLLMVLPYTAGAFLMLRSLDSSAGEGTKAGWFALAGGALAGLAFQINPKGAFDLVFFLVVLVTSRLRNRRYALAEQQAAPEVSLVSVRTQPVSAVRLFCLAVAGFVAGSLPFLAYVACEHSIRSYSLYVWDWGARYGGYYKTGETLLATLRRSAGYFAVNNTLLITLVFVAASFFHRRLSKGRARTDNANVKSAPEASLRVREHDSDGKLLIWFAVSFVGVMLGGRLFPHYFFQILPGLCVIGSRGFFGIFSARNFRDWGPYLRRAAAVLIALGFVFTLVRFHGRSVLLLTDWARGAVSEANSTWYYNLRNREERLIAETVTSASENDPAGVGDVEALRAGGPRTREVDGSADYLFVWGYRPEIYYWSGLLPASRYLSTQPLTGVPADVHYFGDDFRSLLSEERTAAARAELVRDLEETQPKYIIDELGFYNASLSIQSYPELQEFMTSYKPRGTTGRFFVYIRKEFSKKHRQRQAASD